MRKKASNGLEMGIRSLDDEELLSLAGKVLTCAYVFIFP